MARRETRMVPRFDSIGRRRTPDAGMKKGMMKEEGTVGAAPSTEKGGENPMIRHDRPQQNDPE
jgi:hypothetical protein